MARIKLLTNRLSGGNKADSGAVHRAAEILDAEVVQWSPGDAVPDPEPGQTYVAAGGDGTAMALASSLIGTGANMAVLPLGTFNYFARGLGFSEDVEEAARQVRDGYGHEISVGTVNGQVFLNNASLGIYPTILRERESIYDRWGRHRLVAHWSVLRTFLRFRRPMKVTFDLGEGRETRRTALVFVGRSAFQLQTFGLHGVEAISEDNFAVLVARGQTRWDLFRLTARLALRSVEEGRDYDLFRIPTLDVEVHKKGPVLLAFDGEKRRETSPFRFRMSREKLKVVMPPHRMDTA
ncbi:diacylglycerol/lipid kinase family protein [Histidinibacterium aquaticum]|uniref:DAGKc domain-containing protein n=1 Tax=Histidinibacterium aquaticum TaxID=2613962 RepID=A0A5J5GGC7_9RHOB|nr:diacylglycerol kinase family protein [Histidinibacterium aquaticum]KAA9006812.1 hypothetical protein F3S47_13620 [Histidinibacterium aquaticum]